MCRIFALPQILIRRVIRLSLNDETMHPRVPPRLWRSYRTMPGSPRGETSVVDRLEGLQRHASSLRNVWKGFDTRSVLLPKLLGVGGSLCLLSFVRFEAAVISFKHFFVSCFDVFEGGESPEILEWSVYLTFGSTQLTNLLKNLNICERHLTLY